MATKPTDKLSFSRGRKWSSGFHVVLATAAVLAIVIMLNFLGGRYFLRFYASALTRIELAPRTLSVLKALTNEVFVTIYFDKQEPLYSNIADLLKEYHAQNPRVMVATVDYYRDPGAAQEMKLKYNLGASTNKDFIIFDCAGRTKLISGNLLPMYEFPLAANQPDPSRPVYDKKLVNFNGEMLFTPAIFAVSNPKPLKAYFLTGHGEKPTQDAEDAEAYFKFTEVLRQNYITNAPLSLGGTNGVPPDCSLLVIAGPRTALLEAEQEKVEHYLNQGGRLLLLLNAYSAENTLGLESILAKWGVDVSHDTIRDVNNSRNGQDVIVYALTVHPVTRPFLGSPLHVILPRRISRIEPPTRAADLPQVTELAYSSSQSVLLNKPAAAARAYPLMVAVEKSPIKGVPTERGTTRIIVAGDSFLVGNQLIEDNASANLDFAHSAVNWLLERTVLLEGLGPKRVAEYNLLMNEGQMKAVKWILLGAMPGGILLLGGLVWFRRRK